MSQISPFNTALSYDNKQIKTNDIVYQMGYVERMPRLLEIRVVSVVSPTLITIYNPLQNKISPPVPSNTVHTDPVALTQQWIDSLEANLEKIPAAIKHLQLMLGDTAQHTMKLPEIGKVTENIEI